MSFTLSRRLVSEAFGTALLVATIVGSGIMAERLTDDPALALLCNTLPTGAILVVLITLFAPVSGAHFNPAVTLIEAIAGRTKRSDAVLYGLAQIAGAAIGTLVAHAMFAAPILQLSTHIRDGGPQWLAEFIATFGLLVTILLGSTFRPATVPWLVGLYITAAYWFTASTSFANPAVTLARALTDSFSGIRPLDVPAFVAAQMLGALAAYLTARWLFTAQPASTICAGSSREPTEPKPRG